MKVRVCFERFIQKGETSRQEKYERKKVSKSERCKNDEQKRIERRVRHTENNNQ